MMIRIAAKISWLALAIIFFAAAPLHAQQASETVDLRPHFVVGRESKFHVWTYRTQSTSLSVGGHNEVLNSSMELDGQITWMIERVRADGAATCVLTIDWLTTTVVGPDGGSQQTDTRRAAGPDDAMAKMLRAMAGVPVKIEVAADGSITNASGSEAMKRRAGEFKTPDDLDFMETANDLATAAAVPAQAVLNQNWEATYSWNHELGRLIEPTRFTLSSVEEIAGIPVATVTGNAPLRLEVDLSKIPKPASGPAPKVDIRMTSGTATTQIMFDLQRHEAVGRNTTQETQIEAKVHVQNRSFVRVTKEKIQSQTLRVEER